MTDCPRPPARPTSATSANAAARPVQAQDGGGDFLMPMKRFKSTWLWRLRWTIRMVMTGQDQAIRQREERVRRFHLTGLHATYVYGRECPDDEVIAMQARKIKGLEQFIADQRKGYQRKVARLEKQLAEPTRTPPIDKIGPGRNP